MNPLLLAAEKGHLHLFKTLFRDGADIEQDGFECLKMACVNDRDKIVRYLIRSGVDINQTNEEGHCVVHLCVIRNSCRCLKLLVDNGAQMDASGNIKTLLRKACNLNRLSMVEYMFKSSSCTREAKIETLEYMGALCMKDGNLRTACGYWLRSLEERLLAEPCDLVKPKSQRTHPVFGNQFQTAEDLDRIALSRENMWMQAFIILEETVGLSNHLFYWFARNGFSYLECENYRKCMSIAMYIMDRHYQSLGDINRCLYEDMLRHITNAFSQLMSKDPPEPYEAVMPMLIEGVRLTGLAMQPHMGVQISSTSRLIDCILQLVFCSMGFLVKRQPEMLANDLIIFHQMINDFVNLNPCNYRNHRTLHMALTSLDWSLFPSEIVGLLLDAGADPTVADCDNNTPLHIACEQDEISTDVVKLLLEAGVDHRAVNEDGTTALHLACGQFHPSYSCLDVVQLLLQAGANPQARDRRGRTPLHFVACNYYYYYDSYPMLEVVQLLLNAGANPQAVDGDGDTPMHLVASHSHLSKHDVIKLLLSKCCSCAIDICNGEGKWLTDYLSSEIAREIESPSGLCSLQCLSAKAVLTHSIPYQSILPTKLDKFVKGHCNIKGGRTLHPL